MKIKNIKKIAYTLAISSCILFNTASPAFAVDPITAGIASGLAVQLLKGIAASLKGDDVAQVQVRAQTDGPDNDDKAFDGETDKDDLWLEYYLDAEARAEADQGHFAHGELHYAYTGGQGWKPNNVSYITGKEWWGAAVAYPDSTPVPNSKNTTEAAVVGAFSWNGTTIFNGYIDQDKNIVELPQASKVQATNAVLLSFDLSQFSLNSNSSKVFIKPSSPNMTQVDLFHNYAGFSSNDYFNNLMQGFSEYGDSISDELAADMAANAGLSLADASQKAELTFGAASIKFDEKEFDKYKLVGSDLVEKTREELVFEYINSLDILPTSNSQLGYLPNVQYKTGLLNGSSLPLASLDPELAGRLPDVFSGDIGLFFQVDSYLEDAINLAAGTAGSSLYGLFSSMNPGDNFSLELSYGTGESFMKYSVNNAEVPVPEPSSMLLGIISLGGVVLRSRKKHELSVGL